MAGPACAVHAVQHACVIQCNCACAAVTAIGIRHCRLLACRVQQAEAAVAAAERGGGAAALKEEAAVREVQGLQQRIRVMEESAKFKQQIAKQAASAVEPSKLRTELALSQQQVKQLEEQLGERKAAMQEALADTKQLRGAEEAVQEGQREQREAASQAARQLGKKYGAPAASGGSGGGGGGPSADVASLQRQLAKRDKKLDIMTRVLKADSEVRLVLPLLLQTGQRLSLLPASILIAFLPIRWPLCVHHNIQASPPRPCLLCRSTSGRWPSCRCGWRLPGLAVAGPPPPPPPHSWPSSSSSWRNSSS